MEFKSHGRDARATICLRLSLFLPFRSLGEWICPRILLLKLPIFRQPFIQRQRVEAIDDHDTIEPFVDGHAPELEIAVPAFEADVFDAVLMEEFIDLGELAGVSGAIEGFGSLL